MEEEVVERTLVQELLKGWMADQEVEVEVLHLEVLILVAHHLLHKATLVELVQHPYQVVEEVVQEKSEKMPLRPQQEVQEETVPIVQSRVHLWQEQVEVEVERPQQEVQVVLGEVGQEPKLEHQRPQELLILEVEEVVVKQSMAASQRLVDQAL